MTLCTGRSVTKRNVVGVRSLESFKHGSSHRGDSQLRISIHHNARSTWLGLSAKVFSLFDLLSFRLVDIDIHSKERFRSSYLRQAFSSQYWRELIPSLLVLTKLLRTVFSFGFSYSSAGCDQCSTVWRRHENVFT